MKPELVLREIEDRWSRENFFRLSKFFEQDVISGGEWKLYEIRFTKAQANFKHPHKLDFVPYDIILLQVVGDRNVEFHHDLFDRTNINLSVGGACYLRFLAGKLDDKLLTPQSKNDLLNVSVGDALPNGSWLPTYTNGELTAVEVFSSATQTTPNRRARVDITYDTGQNPITETWKIYDPANGTTILVTITFTHTFTNGDWTNTVKATAA